MKKRVVLSSMAVAGLFVLGGCASQQKTLYYWGDYQGQVYEYLKTTEGGDVSKQASILEQGAEQAAAENRPLPPGYHAQLGMLYYAEGKPDQAAEQLGLEKAQYPESTAFVDRLLRKFKN